MSRTFKVGRLGATYCWRIGSLRRVGNASSLSCLQRRYYAGRYTFDDATQSRVNAIYNSQSDVQLPRENPWRSGFPNNLNELGYDSHCNDRLYTAKNNFRYDQQEYDQWRQDRRMQAQQRIKTHFAPDPNKGQTEMRKRSIMQDPAEHQKRQQDIIEMNRRLWQSRPQVKREINLSGITYRPSHQKQHKAFAHKKSQGDDYLRHQPKSEGEREADAETNWWVRKQISRSEGESQTKAEGESEDSVFHRRMKRIMENYKADPEGERSDWRLKKPMAEGESQNEGEGNWWMRKPMGETEADLEDWRMGGQSRRSPLQRRLMELMEGEKKPDAEEDDWRVKSPKAGAEEDDWRVKRSSGRREDDWRTNSWKPEGEEDDWRVKRPRGEGEENVWRMKSRKPEGEEDDWRTKSPRSEDDWRLKSRRPEGEEDDWRTKSPRSEDDWRLKSRRPEGEEDDWRVKSPRSEDDWRTKSPRSEDDWRLKSRRPEGEEDDWRTKSPRSEDDWRVKSRRPEGEEDDWRVKSPRSEDDWRLKSRRPEGEEDDWRVKSPRSEDDWWLKSRRPEGEEDDWRARTTRAEGESQDWRYKGWQEGRPIRSQSMDTTLQSRLMQLMEGEKKPEIEEDDWRTQNPKAEGEESPKTEAELKADAEDKAWKARNLSPIYDPNRSAKSWQEKRDKDIESQYWHSWHTCPDNQELETNVEMKPHQRRKKFSVHPPSYTIDGQRRSYHQTALNPQPLELPSEPLANSPLMPKPLRAIPKKQKKSKPKRKRERKTVEQPRFKMTIKTHALVNRRPVPGPVRRLKVLSEVAGPILNMDNLNNTFVNVCLKAENNLVTEN